MKMMLTNTGATVDARLALRVRAAVAIKVGTRLAVACAGASQALDHLSLQCAFVILAAPPSESLLCFLPEQPLESPSASGKRTSDDRSEVRSERDA